MKDSDIMKTKDLKDFNRCIKQLLADPNLECRAVKGVVKKYP